MSFKEKNGMNHNEMSQGSMTSIENVKTSNRGFELSYEMRNFPATYVNAIRRIVLSSIPTVVIRDVQILDNTTQVPHEMLKHRFEMLPINVEPSDTQTIRDANIELQILANKDQKGVKTVTTDDFTTVSAREKLLMKDRDLDTPMLFLRVRPGESVHIKGKLSVETQHVSQVCVSTTGWHVDEELAKIDKKNFVEAGGDSREFDNIRYQRSYSRDERGRPNWFDVKVESIGVLKSVEIVKTAVSILRKQLENYMKEAVDSIRREQDEGSYSISLEQGGHTIGALLQEVIYSDKNVEFVSYDIVHPLKNTMLLRFCTKKSPESILKTASKSIEEYCSVLEKGL